MEGAEVSFPASNFEEQQEVRGQRGQISTGGRGRRRADPEGAVGPSRPSVRRGPGDLRHCAASWPRAGQLHWESKEGAPWSAPAPRPRRLRVRSRVRGHPRWGPGGEAGARLLRSLSHLHRQWYLPLHSPHSPSRRPCCAPFHVAVVQSAAPFRLPGCSRLCSRSSPRFAAAVVFPSPPRQWYRPVVK